MLKPAKLLTLSRLVAGTIAALFLVGQALVGTFVLPAALAGIAGLGAAMASGGHAGLSRGRLYLVWLGVIGGFAGQILEVHTYYSEQSVPGNDFAWEFRGPFLIGLAYIGIFVTVLATRAHRAQHAV